MKTIFLNRDYECSLVEKNDTVQSIETNIFDGKCNAYIEGFRFIPAGQTWTRKDGVTFTGEMIAPFKDYAALEMAQAVFEELTGQITDTQLAIAELYESGV